MPWNKEPKPSICVYVILFYITRSYHSNIISSNVVMVTQGKLTTTGSKQANIMFTPDYKNDKINRIEIIIAIQICNKWY